MSPPEIEIDVLAVARRVAAQPRRARFSLIEQMAVCQWIVEFVDGLEAQPGESGEQPAPAPIGATLAALIALVIKANDVWAQATGIKKVDAELALEAALNTLKTAFEQEFPNG